jgi:DNA gyrase/topoisomerase IV subunit A
MITDAGMGKRTALKDFPTQGRYGVGVTAAGLSGKQKLVGMRVGMPDEKAIVVTSKGGAKVLKFEDAGRKGRPARGSGIVSLKPNETIVRLTAMLAQIVLPEPPPAPKPAKSKAPAASGDGAAKKSKAKSAPQKETARKVKAPPARRAPASKKAPKPKRKA